MISVNAHETGQYASIEAEVNSYMNIHKIFSIYMCSCSRSWLCIPTFVISFINSNWVRREKKIAFRFYYSKCWIALIQFATIEFIHCLNFWHRLTVNVKRIKKKLSISNLTGNMFFFVVVADLFFCMALVNWFVFMRYMFLFEKVQMLMNIKRNHRFWLSYKTTRNI